MTTDSDATPEDEGAHYDQDNQEEEPPAPEEEEGAHDTAPEEEEGAYDTPNEDEMTLATPEPAEETTEPEDLNRGTISAGTQIDFTFTVQLHPVLGHRPRGPRRTRPQISGITCSPPVSFSTKWE